MLKDARFADLKVGDEVEIEEHYPNGVFFHFRGRVAERSADSVLIGSASHCRVVTANVEGRAPLRIWVKQPDPPTTVGAVVKYYDSNLLQCRTARVDHDGDWYDIAGGQPVELNRLSWTVLFDPAKDA